jgi:hypothetical protein
MIGGLSSNSINHVEAEESLDKHHRPRDVCGAQSAPYEKRANYSFLWPG